jgi:hypothetical protein
VSVGDHPLHGRWANYSSALERALEAIVQHVNAEPITSTWTLDHHTRAIAAAQRLHQRWLHGEGDRSSLTELHGLAAHLSPACGTVVRSVVDTIQAWIQDLEEDDLEEHLRAALE